MSEFNKFDKVYKKYDSFMDLFGLYKTEEIIEELSPNSGDVVCDIGAGTGRLASSLARLCKHVYAVDESENMLSRIEHRSNITVVVADALGTGFEEGMFDGVVIADVIHHIRDQEGAVREAARILKKGGRLVVLDFERKHFKTVLLCAFEMPIFGRLFYRSEKEMKALLENCGFKVHDSAKRGYYYIMTGERI